MTESNAATAHGLMSATLKDKARRCILRNLRSHNLGPNMLCSEIKSVQLPRRNRRPARDDAPGDGNSFRRQRIGQQDYEFANAEAARRNRRASVPPSVPFACTGSAPKRPSARDHRREGAFPASPQVSRAAGHPTSPRFPPPRRAFQRQWLRSLWSLLGLHIGCQAFKIRAGLAGRYAHGDRQLPAASSPRQNKFRRSAIVPKTHCRSPGVNRTDRPPGTLAS